MKRKKIFAGGLVMILCLLTGCKGENTQLDAKNLERNTLSVNKKGVVEDAMVETFDKNYYSDKELEEYLKGIISEYNSTAGEDSVIMDSFHVEDGMARAIFTYKNMNHYKTLTESGADFQSFSDIQGELTGDFQDMEGNTKSVSDISGSSDASKYNVLVLTDALDVIVDGTIQYYSNCDVLGDSSVHTRGEEPSVIIFK